MIEQKRKSAARTQKSVEERKELLGRHIALMVAQGFRVESQSDFQAVMVKGKDVNHILHLILSLVTAGLWLLVWLLLIVTGGEKRSMITVDNFGNVNVAKV